jgi:16S rRNA (guanine966-N2)-methyltransferase
MTRIVAGAVGGRRLQVPPGRRTRPTSERAREGLFSSLGDLEGARFLDLYAGSGAVGLEALSRGAGLATLVEADAPTVRVIRANAAALGLPGVDVRQEKVEQFLTGEGREERDKREEGEPYDVVFLDPPYALDVTPVLALIGRWVEDVVVVEGATRNGPPTWPTGLTGGKARRYGDTTLWYGRRS